MLGRQGVCRMKIINGPLWYTRANETVCRRNHRPRNAGTSERGDCVRLLACQRSGCGECAIGIQTLRLDITVWHSVTRAQYDAICASDPCEPVLYLLHLAQYVDLSDEQDATDTAA